MRKVLALVLVLAMALSLAACTTDGQNGDDATAQTIKVAAIETAYGTEMWLSLIHI